MKLFAQHGSREGEKINEALNRGLLDGVIYSPRDVPLATLTTKLAELAENHSTIERFFDPQYYSIFLNGTAQARLNYLLEDYDAYFQTRRRSQLERENQIRADLRAALEFQKSLHVTGMIAPNILIPSSLNSIEALIAKNFIRLAAEEHRALNDPRPVYATLAISRNALIDKQPLIEFMNDITLLDDPPKGFYLLVSARNTEARSDIYNTDIIAAWMFINHTLRVNGFEVINGYSDILTPFLGAAGGYAGALGWHANLRAFSLDRFAPSSGGGRLPIQRYVSLALLNRITFFELDQLRALVPSVLNNLPSDDLYSTQSGSAPQRNMEVLQSWEAVKHLNSQLVTSNQMEALANCRNAVQSAVTAYENVQSVVRLDSKSNDEHLRPLLDGINLFSSLAELE